MTKLALAIAFLMAATTMPRPNRGEWRGAQDSRIRTDSATIANLAGRRPPSQIASKRQGRPKSFGLWYPAKNLGAQAEAARARVTANSIFFSLASPLAVVPQAARAVSHGQRANIEWQT